MALYGSVEHGIDIEAINKELAVTAIDVFVYDTSKDSDGGAWRNQTQNTSWYNETLNTATRGSRREFPAVVVIVTTTSSITIYDGDDPALPMWMVFNVSGVKNLAFPNNDSVKVSVAMLNAVLVIGNFENATEMGVAVTNFISEKSIRTNSTVGFGGIGNYAISKRNDANFWYGSPPYLLVSPAVNDVAMTVLPNAPVDLVTGLQIPTIAVATNSGVSIIKDNESVVNISDAELSPFYKVEFIGEKLMIQGSYLDYSPWVVSIPNANVTGWNRVGGQPTGITLEEYSITDSNNKTNANLFYYGFTGSNSNKPMIGYENTRFLSSDFALSIIEANTTAPSNGMVSYITSKFNTGFMQGNIKLATLSDTTQETVTGTELITNGTFDTTTTGWSTSNATLSSVSGRLRVTGGQDVAAGQTFATVSGKTYTAKFDVTSVSASNAGVQIINGTQNWITVWTLGATGLGTFSVTFVATSALTSIIFGNYSAAGASSYAEYDNVSVRIAELDRSVSNKGFQVFGSITKTPVATGADLVGYSSGTNTSNYLQQPYNTDLNVGTGDLSVCCWIKMDAIVSGIWTNILIKEAGENFLAFMVHPADVNYGGEVLFKLGSSSWALTDYSPVGKGWVQLYLIRSSGISTLYANGQQVFTTTLHNGNVNVSSGGTICSPTGCNISLLRASATAPSAEQIAKIYNEEKVLFQDNAKATLYGTSDVVTALAYDEKTNLLHVGTSAGRSVFSGLRRVNNTTVAVGTAISAHDGLVAEE